ncbi:MAG: GNAT family N-acetyltransferase, partial [Saprospiraceae bacterium]|nr:GNAT family N-acetyltransferase [Saprospiraceae bacterium]
ANASDGNWYLGYIIKKDYWGGGFGSELATWIVDYCDHTLNLNTVYALIEENNAASRRILKNLEFQLAEKKEENGIGLEVYGLSLRDKS